MIFQLYIWDELHFTMAHREFAQTIKIDLHNNHDLVPSGATHKESKYDCSCERTSDHGKNGITKILCGLGCC
jgi:hypothetical protein